MMSNRYVWMIPIEWTALWWLLQSALTFAGVTVLMRMWPHPAGVVLPLLILTWQASKVCRWLLRRVRGQ